jgi:hypothetical protein
MGLYIRLWRPKAMELLLRVENCSMLVKHHGC